MEIAIDYKELVYVDMRDCLITNIGLKNYRRILVTSVVSQPIKNPVSVSKGINKPEQNKCSKKVVTNVFPYDIILLWKKIYL